MSGTFLKKERPSVGDTREEKNVLESLKQLHPSRNDRNITEKVYAQLLDIKSGTNTGFDIAFDNFIYCWIILQSAFKSSEKCKFRVKLEWTGLITKQEINKLYEIPVQYQNLIINQHVVSDEQPLAMFDFQLTGQIVYVYLTKKKINYMDSQIRISDVIAPRHQDVDMAEGAAGGRETIPERVYDPMDADSDGSSDNATTDSPSTSTAAPKKHRGGKRRTRKNKRW